MFIPDRDADLCPSRIRIPDPDPGFRSKSTGSRIYIFFPTDDSTWPIFFLKERILFIFFTLYMVYVNISELICIKTAQVGTIMTKGSKNTSVQQS